MDREYFSIPEAALRLGLSRIAVFKKVKKGRLEALRFGRNWAVPAAALERAAALGKVPVILKRKAASGIVPAPKKEAEAAPPPSPDADMDSMGWD